jgi:hypothetical protein
MDETTARVGAAAAAAALAASLGYVVVQLLQVAGALGPPIDSILIYAFSLAIAPPFLIAMTALHRLAPEGRRFWSQVGLGFALMYATYVVLVYAVQLVSVIPAGPLADPALTMRPQSMFWMIDGLGYIAMGASTLFAAFALPASGPGRWARRMMIANGCIVPLITFAYVYPHFSVWVLMAGSPWIVTEPGALLALAVYFRRGAIGPR